MGARAGVDPEVQRLQQSKSPVEVEMAEVPAVNVIQQVAQQLTPLVAAIPQVKAGLQREQASPPGDEVVRVMMHPRLPPLELAVGHQQPLLTQVEDAATGIVCHPPQLPRADQAAPAQANQSAATFIHLVQKRQDMQLALHWQEVEREVVVHRFPSAAHGNQGPFPR